MSSEWGKLYVVATPIGNLADFSFRAVEILKQVDWIAAEDTRHAKQLLHYYGINNRLVSLHQHNEEKTTNALLKKMTSGESVALISDAGTPLICDPGLPLVRMARLEGLEVSPIPGACALIAALSVSGISISSFSFEGFAPRHGSERKKFFSERLLWQNTWIFYESSHRIVASLRDLKQCLEPERQVVIARELTKLHETIVKNRIDLLADLVIENENMKKGEFVVIVAGAAPIQESALTAEHQHLLQTLLKHCSKKTAVEMAAEITGVKKKLFYQAALLGFEQKQTDGD